MQSIDSLRELNAKLLTEIAELRKENAEIPELKEKLLRFAEVEAENARLKQIIEENARRDAENAEHKIRIEELEKNSVDISAENAELKAELAKLRHDFVSSNLTRPQQSQHVTNVQNSCSVGEEDISSVIAVPQPDAEPERHLASNDKPDPVIDQCVSIAKQHVADNSDIKSMEERETDAFLGEVYKKSVSNDFRQRNREKKLLRESAIQDSSSVTKDKKSCFSASGQSHKKREAENIIQDVFDFTATSAPEKTHMTEITMTGNPLPVTENTDGKNSVVILSVAKSKPLLNLACLYQKACDAEKQSPTLPAFIFWRE
ncbi:hypothetical protein C1645_415335 [Glomus cerebriforme]|uniref:Uncharacterized protein n=1 Tax=Glomus cerebriforme TaxID=658196 RepID=A0A397SP88_9GLOM|nr:hypothetical protein C1645_415335 [Glomus cerebriforme]